MLRAVNLVLNDTPCPCLISVALTEHWSEGQERVYLPCRLQPSISGTQGRNSWQKAGGRNWSKVCRETWFLMCFPGFLSFLSYTTRDHQTRDGTTQNGLCSPTEIINSENTSPQALEASNLPTVPSPQPASSWIISVFKWNWVLPAVVQELVTPSGDHASSTCTIGKYFSLSMTCLLILFSCPQHLNFFNVQHGTVMKRCQFLILI